MVGWRSYPDSSVKRKIVVMDASFTYNHTACYIKSQHGSGQHIQNTESVEKDVSLVDIEFFGVMALHINNKHSRIQSWTGIIDHVNYHSRTKNLTIAETLEDYSDGRCIVPSKSAKSGHNSIACKLGCLYFCQWFCILFYSP